MHGLTVSVLARLAGVSPYTIRFYERRGLLPRSMRTRTNYRLFPPDAVQTIQFLKNAQELKFTLSEIKELLPVLRSKDHKSCVFKDKAARKIEELKERIHDLDVAMKQLRRLLAISNGHKKGIECPIAQKLTVTAKPTPKKAARSRPGTLDTPPPVRHVKKHRRAKK